MNQWYYLAMTLKKPMKTKGTSPEPRSAEASYEEPGRWQRAFMSKIGRLPEAVRLELNGRLQNSVPAREIADWLNGLPEARAVMAAQFGGAPVTEENVSRWRQTGYAEWLAGKATLEGLRQKIYVGPGAALHYEEEEVETRVREEMLRRYPNGFPAGYRPPTGGLGHKPPDVEEKDEG